MTWRPEWWRAGMLVTLSTGLVVRLGERAEGSIWHAIMASGATCSVDVRHPSYSVEPVPTDPATLGALLGVVREVYGDPSLHTEPSVTGGEIVEWSVFGLAGHIATRSTEFAALVAALEAK